MKMSKKGKMILTCGLVCMLFFSGCSRQEPVFFDTQETVFEQENTHKQQLQNLECYGIKKVKSNTKNYFSRNKGVVKHHTYYCNTAKYVKKVYAIIGFFHYLSDFLIFFLVSEILSKPFLRVSSVFLRTLSQYSIVAERRSLAAL